MHWIESEQAWLTNPDGSSGHNQLDTPSERLTYCQLWFPGTVSVGTPTTAESKLGEFSQARWVCDPSEKMMRSNRYG